MRPGGEGVVPFSPPYRAPPCFRYSKQDSYSLLLLSERIQELYCRHFQVDCFDFLTLPSLSSYLLHRSTKDQIVHWVPRKPFQATSFAHRRHGHIDAVLFRHARDSLLGGYCGSNFRLAASGLQKIYGDRSGSPLIGSIHTLDATLLYSSCLMDDVPVYLPRLYTRDGEEGSGDGGGCWSGTYLTCKFSSLSEYRWQLYLRCLVHPNVGCRSFYFGGQLSLFTGRKLKPDFSVPSLQLHYDYHDCLVHGHWSPECRFRTQILYRYSVGELLDKRLETLKRVQTFQEAGQTLRIMWGCQFQQLLETNPSVREFLAETSDLPGRSRYTSTERLLADIRNGILTGYARVKVHCTDPGRFDYFPQAFERREVTFDELSPFSRELAEKFNRSKKPRLQLLNCHSPTEAQTMDSRMLCFLLESGGYEVTELHYFLQFRFKPVYRPHLSVLAKLRQQAQADGQTALASINKLL